MPDTFPRINFPETNIDPDSLSRHVSDPDPHSGCYLKSNAPLGLQYVKLYRSYLDFRKTPVQTTTGYDPSLVFYIGQNRVEDPVTGITYYPFHPYAYSGVTQSFDGSVYPIWEDKTDYLGDYASAITAAIIRHALDADGLVQRVHPSLASADHTHTHDAITDFAEYIQAAVQDGYLTIYKTVEQFNGVHADETIVIYAGPTSSGFKRGHIYQYSYAKGIWEDTNPDAGDPLTLLDVVNSHNDPEGPFDHANLPYASLDQLTEVRDQIADLNLPIQKVAALTVNMYIGPGRTAGGKAPEDNVSKEYQTAWEALNDVAAAPSTNTQFVLYFDEGDYTINQVLPSYRRIRFIGNAETKSQVVLRIYNPSQKNVQFSDLRFEKLTLTNISNTLGMRITAIQSYIQFEQVDIVDPQVNADTSGSVSTVISLTNCTFVVSSCSFTEKCQAGYLIDATRCHLNFSSTEINIYPPISSSAYCIMRMTGGVMIANQSSFTNRTGAGIQCYDAYLQFSQYKFQAKFTGISAVSSRIQIQHVSTTDILRSVFSATIHLKNGSNLTMLSHRDARGDVFLVDGGTYPMKTGFKVEEGSTAYLENLDFVGAGTTISVLNGVNANFGSMVHVKNCTFTSIGKPILANNLSKVITESCTYTGCGESQPPANTHGQNGESYILALADSE